MRLGESEKKHASIVRAMLAECTVLLKKNGDFPLDGPCDIVLLGNGARKTLRGGTGSGEVYSHFTISVEKALEKAGFNITSKEWLDAYDEISKQNHNAFIKEIKKRANEKHTNPIFEGMGAVSPEPDYDISVKFDGDVAVYVLSRICGEGNDRLPEKGDILLTNTEIRTILELKNTYKKFMLVLNVGGPVDLTPVLEVENILLLSQLGALTGLAFADIILGRKNPSGKLASSWVAWDEYPELFEFGETDDTHYREGIYVGYRYFNTVGQKTMFPFGYGLSYTGFDIVTQGIKLDGETVTVKLSVENIGKFAGKEVAELYVSVPEGKLDQPYQVLAGWVKTDKLYPGEKKAYSISFNMSELAGFDTENAYYILERGDYILRLGKDSENTKVCGAVRLEDDIVVRKVRNALGDSGFDDFRPEKAIGVKEDYKAVEFDKNSVTTSEAEYLQETEIDEVVKSLSTRELVYLNIGAFEKQSVGGSIIGNAGRLVAGAAGETTGKLKEKGIPAVSMADGPAGLRISQKFWRDETGAHSVGNTMLEGLADFMPKPVAFWAKRHIKKSTPENVEIHTQYTTAIPIGTALAQSWNLKLAEECGDIVGREMREYGVGLWLAPAMNIHRNIRCGRNFEYYSEDPLITGRMGAAITKGVQKNEGCGVTVKHFCANNQEFNRFFNNSCVSERAMREIYLKGFEICIREANPYTIMSSYNLLNGIHTNERRDLITDILRCEFGFKGVVMTDWLIGEVSNYGIKYPRSRASKIAAAGGEIVMPGCIGDFRDICIALKEKELERKQLEINATRLIRLIRKLS